MDEIRAWRNAGLNAVVSHLPPDELDFNLFERIEAALAQGKKITVHCRQVIGRSGLIAASLLVARGTSPAVAVEQVEKARHVTVPETPEQRAWIDTFAATLSPAGHRPRK
jgi:protein-tyrosine phosphatase